MLQNLLTIAYVAINTKPTLQFHCVDPGYKN